jgi:hypothetical protein
MQSLIDSLMRKVRLALVIIDHIDRANAKDGLIPSEQVLLLLYLQVFNYSVTNL